MLVHGEVVLQAKSEPEVELGVKGDRGVDQQVISQLVYNRGFELYSISFKYKSKLVAKIL